MVVVSRMGNVMNEWTKQRDLLIEETLAFVQGVAVNASRISSQIDSLNIAGFGGFRQPNKALTTRAWILLPLSVG